MSAPTLNSQAGEEFHIGSEALTAATMSISKDLITKLNRHFERTDSYTGNRLFGAWLDSRQTVLKLMGYDADCDPGEFVCDLSIEPSFTDKKSRVLSLIYSGWFYQNNGKDGASRGASQTGDSESDRWSEVKAPVVSVRSRLCQDCRGVWSLDKSPEGFSIIRKV